jgi:hypothetical protein
MINDKFKNLEAARQTRILMEAMGLVKKGEIRPEFFQPVQAEKQEFVPAKPNQISIRLELDTAKACDRIKSMYGEKHNKVDDWWSACVTIGAGLREGIVMKAGVEDIGRRGWNWMLKLMQDQRGGIMSTGQKARLEAQFKREVTNEIAAYYYEHEKNPGTGRSATSELAYVVNGGGGYQNNPALCINQEHTSWDDAGNEDWAEWAKNRRMTRAELRPAPESKLQLKTFEACIKAIDTLDTQGRSPWLVFYYGPKAAKPGFRVERDANGKFKAVKGLSFLQKAYHQHGALQYHQYQIILAHVNKGQKPKMWNESREVTESAQADAALDAGIEMVSMSDPKVESEVNLFVQE